MGHVKMEFYTSTGRRRHEEHSVCASPARFAGLALLAAVSAAAAQGVNLGGHDAGAPISVSADNFTGDFKTKVGTYSGNVIVSQGNFKLHADAVRVDVANGKPDKIVAAGHVLFDAPSGTASGDQGIYALGARTITLTRQCGADQEQERHARHAAGRRSGQRPGHARRQGHGRRPGPGPVHAAQTHQE